MTINQMSTELEKAAIHWWKGHRPVGWSADKHIKNPTVNAGYTDRAKRLAIATAKHIGAKSK